MAVKKKKKVLNDKGQAILEFLLFLPFMLMLYSVTLSIGSAINSSINQQKVTRGYFFYRLQNNSTLPKPRRDGSEPSDGWQTFGFQIMGWATELRSGSEPIAPCFKFRLPLGDSEDGCEDRYPGETSQFIRTKTVIGICGATYVKNGTEIVPYPRAATMGGGANLQHCQII